MSRDAVSAAIIAQLAADEADLREQVVIYRALALTALEQLHTLHAQHDRLRDENRRLRAHLLTQHDETEAA
jgi:acetyl esterase/lipase